MFFPTDEARFYVRKELYDQEHTALRHISPINGSGFRETKQDLAVKYGDSLINLFFGTFWRKPHDYTYNKT